MAELLEAHFELLDEFGGDVLVHEGAGGRDAGLTAVEKKVLAVVLERIFNVCVRENERRGFAAELEGYAFEIAV